jgi:hypothetical protein
MTVNSSPRLARIATRQNIFQPTTDDDHPSARPKSPNKESCVGLNVYNYFPDLLRLKEVIIIE